MESRKRLLTLRIPKTQFHKRKFTGCFTWMWVLFFHVENTFWTNACCVLGVAAKKNQEWLTKNSDSVPNASFGNIRNRRFVVWFGLTRVHVFREIWVSERSLLLGIWSFFGREYSLRKFAFDTLRRDFFPSCRKPHLKGARNFPRITVFSKIEEEAVACYSFSL